MLWNVLQCFHERNYNIETIKINVSVCWLMLSVLIRRPKRTNVRDKLVKKYLEDKNFIDSQRVSYSRHINLLLSKTKKHYECEKIKIFQKVNYSENKSEW